MFRIFAIVLSVLFLACGSADSPTKTAEAAPQPSAEDLIAPGPHEVAVMTMRDLGTIRFELFPEIAPKTVTYFKKIANEGIYDGMTFHRVVPGFILQGGDPNSQDDDPRNDGDGGGAWLENEFSTYPHTRGTVSLANRGRKNSGGSQFFIVHQDSPRLDGKYNVFGRIIEGIEVVDKMTEVEIDKFGRYGITDRPYPVDVVIEKLRVVPAESSDIGVAGQ